MLAADVNRLLTDFGSLLTLTRGGTVTYDPATGLASVTGGAPFTILAVFISYKDENVDGSTIRRGDRRLLVAAQGSQTAPIMDDMVGGLKVVDVQTIAPNGTAVAYACQMRK